MGILGINISHDGTLSFVQNGKHIFSLAEERILRKKAFLGFPFSTLRYIIDNGILDPEEVDCVAVAVDAFPVTMAETFSFLLTENKSYYDLQNDEKPKWFYNSDATWVKISTESKCQEYVQAKISALLADCGINASIEFHNHHLCHAASAYYSSGLEDKKVLAITMDGEGDGLSASVNICENGKIQVLSQTQRKDSAGNIYSAVTKFCGFKVSRHEGKITGLAAYGDSEKAYKFFSKYIFVRDGKLCIDGLKNLNIFQKIRNKILYFFGFKVLVAYDELVSRCGDISYKDLSAGIQTLLEERISEIVAYWIDHTGVRDLVLAGGVFANVKFNQKISELDCVDSLYVYPDMGDGGLAYGAAMLSDVNYTRFDPKISKLRDVYLGPEFTDEDVKVCIANDPEIVANLSNDIARESAVLIANKKILGWFQGRMEYGPRSLGNRSILATPVDANINKWLNERLKRTEFMPFAPSCLYESSDRLFDIPKESLKRAAEFMTITFKVKEAWLDKVPAVIHVDNTARPQLVKKATNPAFYELLIEFEKLTGLPLVVNTSFNSHEEPIICHPNEAINALKRGIIDVLAIGNYVVRRK